MCAELISVSITAGKEINVVSRRDCFCFIFFYLSRESRNAQLLNYASFSSSTNERETSNDELRGRKLITCHTRDIRWICNSLTDVFFLQLYYTARAKNEGRIFQRKNPATGVPDKTIEVGEKNAGG